MNIILANIISLIGNCFLIISPFCKNKKKIISFQLVDNIAAVVSCILLEAYTGIVMALCACIRNTLCIKYELSKKVSAIIVTVISIIAIATNNMGLLGIIPIIATIMYSYTICLSQNTLHILIILMLNNAMYLVYNFCIKNYTASVFKFIVICTSFINIIKILKSGEQNGKDR